MGGSSARFEAMGHGPVNGKLEMKIYAIYSSDLPIPLGHISNVVQLLTCELSHLLTAVPNMETSTPNMDAPPPTTSEDHARLVGSFEHDFKYGAYPLCWENRCEMEAWMLKEEEKNTVEFIK